MPVGARAVGRMNDVRPVADIMADLVREADETIAGLGKSRLSPVSQPPPRS